MDTIQNHKAELFVALQRLLPKHTLSRLIARLAESKQPWLKNFLIRQAIRKFDINLLEAFSSDLNDYENFNAFFTRALSPEARTVASEPLGIISPADGMVSQIGHIHENRIIQAKGIDYSPAHLLGNSIEAELFADGTFTTIYLSPRDYHRVHIPFSGKLLGARYIPGELFSVNDQTAQCLPGLFTRNERLVCQFEGDIGKFSVILVGAMLVAGIETVWGGFESPNPGTVRETDFSDQELVFSKGDEIGRFKFGSTVILLFQNQMSTWSDNIYPGSNLRMGELIGNKINT